MSRKCKDCDNSVNILDIQTNIKQYYGCSCSDERKKIGCICKTHIGFNDKARTCTDPRFTTYCFSCYIKNNNDN